MSNAKTSLDLGCFSVSLAVADLAKSLAFYKTLGFEQIDGDGKAWIILQNGEAKVGLFHGMFEGNIMTFNPTDARGVQAVLRKAGYAVEKPAEDEGKGPTHLMVRDPDGNAILVDQHVETP